MTDSPTTVISWKDEYEVEGQAVGSTRVIEYTANGKVKSVSDKGWMTLRDAHALAREHGVELTIV
jgi:hypothetical protein